PCGISVDQFFFFHLEDAVFKCLMIQLDKCFHLVFRAKTNGPRRGIAYLTDQPLAHLPAQLFGRDDARKCACGLCQAEPAKQENSDKDNQDEDVDREQSPMERLDERVLLGSLRMPAPDKECEHEAGREHAAHDVDAFFQLADAFQNLFPHGSGTSAESLIDGGFRLSLQGRETE